MARRQSVMCDIRDLALEGEVMQTPNRLREETLHNKENKFRMFLSFSTENHTHSILFVYFVLGGLSKEHYHLCIQ